MMAPEEISEYKEQWLDRATSLAVPSELDVKGKDWCRRHLERQCWSMIAFTGPAEHTFRFEHEQDATEFAKDIYI